MFKKNSKPFVKRKLQTKNKSKICRRKHTGKKNFRTHILPDFLFTPFIRKNSPLRKKITLPIIKENLIRILDHTKSGFSLMEVLVAMGIIGFLTSVAVPPYLKYRRISAIHTLNETAQNFLRAYHTCMLIKSDTTLCDSFSELRFNCDLCNGGIKVSTQWKYYGGKIKSDTFYNMSFSYEIGGLKGGMSFYKANDNNLSVSGARPVCSRLNLHPPPPIGQKQTGWYNVNVPMRYCEADSDCKTREICFNLNSNRYTAP